MLVQPRPRIDRDGTIDNSPSGLIKPTHKLAKLVIETNSKVYKPKTYNETVNDPIYRNKWTEIIDKKL